VNKVRETIGTMTQAIGYSFAFCWRNGRAMIIQRIVISLLVTFISYYLVKANGHIFNAVQESMVRFKGARPTFVEVITGSLFWPLLSLVVAAFLLVVLSRFKWYYRSKWGQVLRYANERELNNHRASLDIARFRSKEYDDLSKRIDDLSSSWQTRIFFSEEIFNLLVVFVSFLLFGSSLILFKMSYAFILLATVLPMVIIEFKLVSKWWNLSTELVPHNKKRGMLKRAYYDKDVFVQAQMFNQMSGLRKEIDINVDGVLTAYEKIRRITMQWSLPSNIFSLVGLYYVIAHAVFTTVRDTGEIGTLTVIIVAAKTFQNNLQEIVQSLSDQWNNAKGVILIEKDFLGLKPMLQTKYPVVPKFDIVPEIRFDNVSFAYPSTDNTVPVLKNVSFTIKSCSKVAIVGKSGGGKTTVQALLMRQYDPTSGSVFAGNVNLQNIEPKVWSEVASSLTQEFEVLSRTTSQEIASSRIDFPIDLEAVKASARFAHFDEVVSSDPKGYDSQIGTEFGGRDFSGGERQRLALARVHYRGTPILILDEPDSKLDPNSAQKVVDRIFELKDITVIIITHCISRAERCDHVLVVDNGEIAEQGSHDELMAQGGLYVSLREEDRKRIGANS